jgi:serine/threonine protein kinase
VVPTLPEIDSLGEYDIVIRAGEGGMGVVYKATQRSLDRVVALKVIRDDIARTIEYRERFMREARLAASVDHPHVVPIYDLGDADGKLFVAMQWIDGEDLKRLLASSGHLPPDRAAAIVVQVADALDAVHAAGLVHRDVKPANVLLRQVGGRDHAYLTDFGVAKPSEPTEQLTQTGWVVGTSGYLSPEQIMGEEPGPRSDLYALACLFFEVLAGRPPFQRDNEMALRWAHAHDPRPRVSALVPGVGSRYDDFLAFALAVDPAHRFASGREFADALLAAHDGRPRTNATSGTPPDHPPTAIGPPAAMPSPASTPPPGPLPYPAYGYGTPPPPQKASSGSPLALILLTLVAVAGIAVGALAATGVLSGKSAPVTQAIAGPSITRTLTQRAASDAQHSTIIASTSSATQATSAGSLSSVSAPSAPPSTTTAAITTSPAPSQTAAPQTSSALPATPTGTDSSGYNIGPGCSDDPASPLPGCADSPSVPAGDAEGSCPNGITVDSRTTSCGLAENVYAGYTSDGPLTAYSPERDTDYQFECHTGGPGTTGYTICLGAAGTSELYVRWHP